MGMLAKMTKVVLKVTWTDLTSLETLLILIWGWGYFGHLTMVSLCLGTSNFAIKDVGFFVSFLVSIIYGFGHV